MLVGDVVGVNVRGKQHFTYVAGTRPVALRLLLFSYLCASSKE